ncbi:MAG: 4-(cytidine 5'-diphospho)-2-C-methyl-D-erythritol kinase [Bacteroidota bacterium]
MIYFPNAKINIGLYITEKRTDGFHNLESIMVPLTGILFDAMEIISIPSSAIPQEKEKRKAKLLISGIPVSTDAENNLCIKAYNLLAKDFSLPSIKIYLHKIIPMGAGLGGGSSDGAFMIKLLNEKFNLELSEQKMLHYASQLGSDCSFFIFNQPAFISGRGEKIIPLSCNGEKKLNLNGCNIAIVYPNISISTAEAYSHIIPKKIKVHLSKLISQPIEKWKHTIHNDFEDVVFPKHPAIKHIKEKLYSLGAIYASMSGSGSAVYGIFHKKTDIEKNFPSCFVKVGQL